MRWLINKVVLHWHMLWHKVEQEAKQAHCLG